MLAVCCQTQAVSTISQMMIFNSKNEFGSQKPDTQTQTHCHTKTKETPVPVYLGMKLHCCCTLHLASQTICEKGDKNEIFEDCSKKHGLLPVFPYWSCVLELELSILQFTQSIETAYFSQFIQTLTKLLPCCCCCCFALDDINCARWLSVYLCDMCQLGGTHQSIKPFVMVDFLCTST